ncbi:MAG: beta-galactosidase trimerization domain-containing protein [Clostridiales bacterium]|nr:beta-galactosidase trimerization domain-containing protein [Clostridiales bacterium]
MKWHLENEEYLYHRTPISQVGLVWSQLNVNFYGKDNSQLRCAEPWRGFTRALTRARIPGIPIHADHISRYASQLSVMVLPELASMTDDQVEAVENFVKQGGSMVYTGATGMLDEWGDPRKTFPLDELFGIKRRTKAPIEELKTAATEDWEQFSLHNYLRLKAPGRQILQGFENTDILPFGGQYYEVESDNLQTVATLVPAFPIYPPEISFMDPDKKDSGLPMILCGDTGYGGKVVYFAGDIDRRYCQYSMGDHGDLIAQAVRYALQGKETLKVNGKGYLDCRLYRQEKRFVLHMVNLSGANQFPGLLEEEYTVGPFEVSVKAEDFSAKQAKLKCSGKTVPVSYADGWITFLVDHIDSQELIVIE